MKIQELFIMSNKALQKVVAQIKDDQWGIAMPPGMSSTPGDLEDAVRSHTYDDAWVPDVLAGKTTEEVGDVYDSLKTTGDIQANYSKYNQRAIDAVQDFTDVDRVVHISYGDFAAKDYLQHIIAFRAFRSYDLAKLIGVDTTMDDTFVHGLLEEFTPGIVDSFRQMGVFPPAITAPDDASPQTKLLALVGRE